MKNQIIHSALENLRQVTDIQTIYINNGELDGSLEMILNKQKTTFIAEIKNEIRHYQFDNIEGHNRKYRNYILVANRIFPKVKSELVRKGIAFLETNGNIFIQKNNYYIYINTNKPTAGIRGNRNRAFTKTGLKVLFHLLNHKEDINLTQRELAKEAGVGLGTVPQVIKGLREDGYVIPLNSREFVWNKRVQLLEKWIEMYGTILKPGLNRDRFTTKANWQEIPFNSELTLWGGEPAADILTNYLRPEKLSFYTLENRTALMKNYGLIPNPKGEIEAFDLFWKPEGSPRTVPTILIYADLVLEGGKRNLETAEIIWNEYVKTIL